ncbi:MAG: DUF819 family protein [Pseudomonadota bacterium]
MTVSLVILYLVLPALILRLCFRYPAINKISPVLLSYLIGIILGNAGILPESFLSVQTSLSEVTVALSLPLLLFSMNVWKWFQIAGKAILSIVLATASIIAISFLLYFYFKEQRQDAWQLSGMAIGVYTGGTPNLAAIKTALNIDSSTYILFHTYDTVISFLYIMFLISGAQAIFNRFLLPYQRTLQKKIGVLKPDSEEVEDIDAYKEIFKKDVLLPNGGAVLLSIAIVGVSVLLGGLVPKHFSAAVTILSITSFGILFSFIPKIRNIKNTFQTGMYIIYIFCIVVASMTDIAQITHINWQIMGFVAVSIVGSLIVHAILCKLFRVDTDTFLITSTSAICSPPFVPVVAAALKNKTIILSGLTTGIIGYAIGNYLGITLAYLFKLIP